MNKQQILKRMEQLYKQAKNWPRWKKEYFNEHIAISANGRKVEIDEEE